MGSLTRLCLKTRFEESGGCGRAQRRPRIEASGALPQPPILCFETNPRSRGCSIRDGRHQSAFTLVETIVVIAMTSILLGAAVTMIYSLNRWDQGMRDRYIGREQALRLAETMRKEIRQAERVSLADNGVLEVALPSGAVTRYEATPEGCRREFTLDGDEKRRDDFFSIGKSEGIKLEHEEQGGQELLIITLPLVDTSDRPMIRAPLNIYAVLGADLPKSASDSASE